MNLIYDYLHDFISLFFPQLCATCGKNLFKSESTICTQCFYHLPYTNFHLDDENRVVRQLYGRIPFESAAAFLYFAKGSKVQNLIHGLKYNNKPEIGTRLGEMYGQKLKAIEKFKEIDLILPVPLHPKRLKKRGYNQSEYFAMGLSNSLEIPLRSDILVRPVATSTQTQKSRFSRFENMKDVFSISNSELLQGKHVLLVDDVLTTGATVEACALELLKVQALRISIASIAFAE